MTSRGRAIGVSWLALSILLGWLLFAGAGAHLRHSLQEPLEQHLLLTLEESHFSSSDNSVSDQAALARLAQRINESLDGIAHSRWYAPLARCEVGIAKIDDIDVSPSPVGEAIRLSLPRNQVERNVDIGVSCSRNWLPVVLLCLLLGGAFLALQRTLPRPLSGARRYWVNYLLGRGYGEARALEMVSGIDDGALSLDASQRECLELLHDAAQHNFPAALAVASDPRVAGLAPAQLEWLLLGLRGGPAGRAGDLDAALALANAPDEVVVDLTRATLTVRGLEIPVGITPLFYYAWYARRRLDGEGWVRNPASNRPDARAGRELAALMSAHGGHARAINDLEQAGLKARTLDQNRSKIKDEMVAVLGESLAMNYLFESEKDAGGPHMKYRIRPGRDRLRLLWQGAPGNLTD